jgi:hypothetical protein
MLVDQRCESFNQRCVPRAAVGGNIYPAGQPDDQPQHISIILPQTSHVFLFELVDLSEWCHVAAVSVDPFHHDHLSTQGFPADNLRRYQRAGPSKPLGHFTAHLS